MQWSSDPNGGFSVAPEEALYAPVINDPVYGYEKVNVAAQRDDETSLLAAIRRMVHARKALPVLADGGLLWMDDLPKQALCFQRKSDAGTVVALHNLSDQPLEIPLPDSIVYRDALDNSQTAQGTLTLAAYGYKWLMIE